MERREGRARPGRSPHQAGASTVMGPVLAGSSCGPDIGTGAGVVTALARCNSRGARPLEPLQQLAGKSGRLRGRDAGVETVTAAGSRKDLITEFVEHDHGPPATRRGGSPSGRAICGATPSRRRARGPGSTGLAGRFASPKDKTKAGIRSPEICHRSQKEMPLCRELVKRSARASTPAAGQRLRAVRHSPHRRRRHLQPSAPGARTWAEISM